MKKQTTKPLRNVLNVHEVDKYCATLGRGQPAHIRDWFKSTFRSWMLNEYDDVKPVFHRKGVSANMLMLVNVLCRPLVDEGYDALESLAYEVEYDSQPDWVKRALDAGEELLHISKPDRDRTVVYHHWRDYMATLPAKPMRQTVADLQKSVQVWDQMLKNQKIQADAHKGYSLVVLKCLNGTEWKFFKLTTREAHKYEGRVMNHCAGSYAVSFNRVIYSLMKGDHHEMTLEVQQTYTKSVRRMGGVASPVDSCVVQAMANSNQEANAEQQAILDQIYAELKWTVNIDDSDNEEWA